MFGKKNFRKQKYDSPVIPIGEFFFKQSRIRLVIRIILEKHPELNVLFLNSKRIRISDLTEGVMKSLSESIKKDEDNILMFYEGNYLYNRVLRLLSIRPRSVKEVREFLKKNANNLKSIDLIVNKLGEFLNDYDFAEYLISKERSHNPKGNLVIKYKLLEKGIDKDIIEELLYNDEDNELELIEVQFNRKRDEFIRKIMKKGDKYKKETFNMKMKSYLVSKGFSEKNISIFLKENEVDF